MWATCPSNILDVSHIDMERERGRGRERELLGGGMLYDIKSFSISSNLSNDRRFYCHISITSVNSVAAAAVSNATDRHQFPQDD